MADIVKSGDLSSGSSEGHTDVAIRDNSRRTQGFVKSSGGLYADSRGPFSPSKGRIGFKIRSTYRNGKLIAYAIDP